MTTYPFLCFVLTLDLFIHQLVEILDENIVVVVSILQFQKVYVMSGI